MARAGAQVRRRVVSITGSRADYGLMEPVHRKIASDPSFELHLIVTGMHFLPDFASSLAAVRQDTLGALHELPITARNDSGEAMAVSIGEILVGVASKLREIGPDLMLLQGDRGEMLAGAIAAAHMNVPIVHMSGGDVSGSVDDPLRHAISKLASIHLTNCRASSDRLLAMGESAARIVEVGEPGLDQLLATNFIPFPVLAEELKLSPNGRFLIATLHPVADEADQAAAQMRILIEALREIGLETVFTHPNSDAGGRAMRAVLEFARGEALFRIVPSLGSRRYLSLLRHAAAVVGNSSSGLYDTPTLKVPAVNIGSRQAGRTRAQNVIDVGFDQAAIVAAIRYVLNDPAYRNELERCRNPYGDGHAAALTVNVLKRLNLNRDLVAKWRDASGPFLMPSSDGA